MLTKVEVHWFRSFAPLELEMSPLTVLIGPNGGGKSNLLDIFGLLAEAASGSLGEAIAARGGYRSVVHRGGAAIENMSFRLSYTGDGPFGQRYDPVSFEAVLQPTPVGSGVLVAREKLTVTDNAELPTTYDVLDLHHGKGKPVKGKSNKPAKERLIESAGELAIAQVRDEWPHRLASELSSWRVYRPVPTDADSAIRWPQLVRSGTRVAQDGGNLASVLHVIQSQHPAVWDELCDVLRTAYPCFQNLSFPAEGGDGKIMLRWWEEPYAREYGFSANLLSDGTLRLLMLLAILLSPDPPPLVCLDEPELGLHPDWIKLIGELLQDAASRTQLVVATHSPELVSKLQPSQVVVVEKENGRTIATRLSDDEYAHWLDEFRLGDLWRAGHLGGRP